MYLSLSAAILSLFSSIPQLNSSTTNSCSLLGPVFPPPSVLSTDPNIIKAGDSLALALETLKQNASTTGYGPLDFKDNSFSIQVFSLYQQEPTHQYHYTAPSLSNSTVGTRKVDQDSIYRAGSVTKLLTVWLVLIEAGEAVIHDPITKYVPELAEIDARGCGGSTSSQDNTDCVMWKDVTVGDLGSHMAGIQKELTLGDLSAQGLPITQFGFPTLNASDIPNCSVNKKSSPCDRKAFFTSLQNSRPIFAPASTPQYSNTAFQILGYALQTLTNKSFEQIFNDRIITALSLNRTSYFQPPTSLTDKAVIPVDPVTSLYSVSIGDEGPAGGIYSSPSDLATMARAILSSRLLPPATTRRWMKPVTHTASFTTSIGMPWEIQRIPSSRIVDIYNKEGDLGLYASMLTLFPDYAAGFVVMTAGTTSVTAMQILSEKIVDNMLPALEQASREQATNNFAGDYRSPTVNSSISLAADSGPGLKLTRWISNGTDFLSPTFAKALGAKFSGVRLFPANPLPTSTSMGGNSTAATTQMRWRASFEKQSLTDGSTFSDQCPQWADMTQVIYGGMLLSEFLFEVGGDEGKATGVRIPALEVELKREG